MRKKESTLKLFETAKGKKFMKKQQKEIEITILCLFVLISMSLMSFNLDFLMINRLETKTFSSLTPQLSDSTPMWVHTAGDSIEAVAISANGDYIVSGGRDNIVYFFNSSSSTPLWNYTLPSFIRSVAISADGNYIVVGAYWDGFFLFNKASHVPIWNYSIELAVQCLAISEDGNYIVAGEGNNLLLFNRSSPIPIWTNTSSNINSVSISSNGSYIAAAEWGSGFSLYSRSSSTPLWTYSGVSSPLSIDISSDGEYIAGGSLNHHLYFFNKSSPIPMWDCDMGINVESIAISSDGNTIAAISTGNLEAKLSLFDKSSSTPLWNFSAENPGSYRDVAISSDGSYITFSHDESILNGKSSIYFFEKSNSTPIWSFTDTGNYPNIQTIAISSDGSFLTAGSQNTNHTYFFSPPPNLSFFNFQIDDDNSGNSQGDNDGLIDAGETIELRITLQNTGGLDASNVNATISSSDKNILIIDNFQNFTNIPQDTTRLSTSNYIFKINSSCPSDYYITLNLKVNASNWGPWYDSFQIHIVGSGNPVYHSFSVYSESDGDLHADNDDIIDSGEIIIFNLTTKNLGGANLYGVSGLIEENDPYIIIDDDSGYFETLNSNGGESSGQFGINVSGACPDKHRIDFTLNLTDIEGTLWELTFFLIVNATPDYKIYDFILIEYDGNGDNFVDAGESWYADILIKNNGSAIGKEIHVLLNCSDPYVSFYNSSRNLYFGDVNVNETDSYDLKQMLNLSWRFTISDITPVNHTITFGITITDNSGTSKTYQVNITVIENVSSINKNGDDLVIVIIIMIITLGIVGSIGLFYRNRKRKEQIKLTHEPRKKKLNPTVRKVLYFTPIVVFFVVWWVDVGFTVSYLNTQGLDIFDWAFRWVELTDNYLIYTNTFSSFFFGCYSWAIITYYLGTKNLTRHRRALKSLYIYYPFWFGMCTYLGLIGVETYYNSWLLVHVIFGIWVALGSIIAIYMVLTSSEISLTRAPRYTIPRSKSIKLRDFFDRFQAFFFILIISTVGTSLSILLWKESTHMALINISLTSLTILMIFLLNYLFTMKIDYHKRVKQKEEERLLNNFQILLRRSKELAEKGNKNFTNKSYRPAIENWEKSINYYEEALKKAAEKEKIKENLKILKESVFNAYKGRANAHNKDALKAYDKSNLQIAQKEWRLAVSSFQSAIDLNKDEKLNFSPDDLQKAIKNTEIRLEQLEIEMVILDADDQLKEARSLQKKDLRKAIIMVNGIIFKYSEAKEKANKNALLKPLSKTLETRIIKCRDFQLRLQDKMDQLIGITPISKNIKVDEIDIIDYKIPSEIKEDKKETLLSIVREFEFIGGQIRFKIGLINNTKFPFTNLKITFNIPDALKWILNEPSYERKGDSLLISKLGVSEKKAVSLYLEPINCMESPINATVSFFDVRDKPHALTMKPKMISITCPIFFTEGDANLARVKSLRRKLAHHDTKIFPLIKSEESLSIFSSILSVLEKFDIKSIFKDFSEEDRFGEAWFYGITKVKKNQFVIYVLLDDTNKKVEIEVSGNDEQQITAFLAEIGDRTRKQLIQNKIIDVDDEFYDMRITILSNLCPYCYTSISVDQVQKIINGKIIRCTNCDVELKIELK